MTTAAFPFRITLNVSQDMKEYIDKMVEDNDYLTRADALRILVNKGITKRKDEI